MCCWQNANKTFHRIATGCILAQLVYTKLPGTWARMISLPCLFILKQNKIESFKFTSAVHGYHIYKEIWEPNVGDKFVALRELHNQFDKICHQSAKRWGNSGPSTTRILENSVVFSRSWRIDICWSYWPSSTLQTALRGNRNSVLRDVFLFEKSNHKPLEGSPKKEGLTL